MLDHVTIRVSDRAAADRFYRTLLEPLAIEPTHVADDFVEWDDFSVAAADEAHPPTRNLHIGFCAISCGEVDASWQAGVDAGYADDGAPGERPQ